MEIKVPGQELEKAAAAVATDAGRTLVGALRRRLNAWAAKASAYDEAAAQEIKRDAAHKGKIARSREREAERRQSELDEFDHRHALQMRAIGRTLSEIEHSQESVEYVARQAVRLVEAAPNEAFAADLEDDWLAKFFRYVGQVDEQEVLDVLARALADAAVGRPKIPSKALDTLRFFDRESYAMFQFAARLLTLFEVVPEYALQRLAERKGIPFDATRLVDLGLLTEQARRTLAFSIGEVRCAIGYEPAVKLHLNMTRLTYAGMAIAALFSPAQRALIEGNRSVHVPVGQTWQLQRDLGIEADDIDILGITLIQQISDTWPVVGMFNVIGGSDESSKMEFERKALRDPFCYRRLDDAADGLDANNIALFNRFIDRFDEFDTRELPVIIARMEASD